MTASRRRALRAAFTALLAGGLAAGCAGLRPPAAAVAPPAGYSGATAAARAGFHAVYEGELRLWFHSIKAIWYVAVAPGADHLAVAMLSPTGITILQAHGDSAGRVCDVRLAPAARLQPYGAALWDGLWWGLAAGDPVPAAGWTLRRNRTSGSTTQGPMQATYRTAAAGTAPERIDLRRDGRRWGVIRLDDFREDAGRAVPARIRLDCARPRCRLILTLKSITWTTAVASAPGEARP